jgi:hypothetical protein
MTIVMPERSELKVLYDAAIAEVNTSRNNALLTTSFYAKTGDAVFDAGYLALSDALTDTRRMHTVSAPAGGGKTSFSYALAAAVTRYAENNSDAPYGVVFVVDQMEKADEVFCALSALLPGKVAVWSTDHDLHCKAPEKVKEPAAQFTREELQRYPVIVVTHTFYLGTRGQHARSMVRNGALGVRALTIVDEKPNEAPTLEVLLSEAQAVREAVALEHHEAKVHLDALLRFMETYSYAAPNKLYRPGIEVDRAKLADDLGWFRTSEAALLAKATNTIPGIDRLVAFAKALVVGRACVVTNGAGPQFFGYEEHRIIDLTAGTILLDATADIDGVSGIVPWRVQTETPKGRYDNLEITHVAQHTKISLSKYLMTATNQRSYVEWVVATIKQNMKPGEYGLVVCKKRLFEAERIPTWPEGDPRHLEPKGYTEDYGWDLEGRKLCATHWGTGIGSNAWRKAGVVFLFDEFIVPRRVSVATTQSLRGHRVHEGDLGAMRTLNSKAHSVDSIAEGHALRWTKQLALRGKARFYDGNGVCGEQRLVVGSDLKRFMANAAKLFPGARITTVGNHPDNTPLANRIIELLSKTPERTVTTKVLGKLIGKAWRDVVGRVLTPEFQRSILALGWRYVALRGRLGSRCERTYQQLEAGVL